MEIMMPLNSMRIISLSRNPEIGLITKCKPKAELPIKCYIYATKPRRKNQFGLCRDDLASHPFKIGTLYKSNYRYAEENNLEILSGKIVGEFVLTEVSELDDTKDIIKKLHSLEPNKPVEQWTYHVKNSKRKFYRWKVEDLTIYDNSLYLYDFGYRCKALNCDYCANIEWKQVNVCEHEWECRYDEFPPMKRGPGTIRYVKLLYNKMRTEASQ